jgi:hypothetical protein
MSIAIRPPARVTLVQATVDPPSVGHGTVTRNTKDSLEVDLDKGSPVFTIGTSLILEFAAESGPSRAIVSVTSASADKLTARIRRIPPPDKREYPRCEGAVHVRYHVSALGPDGVEPWMAGGAATGTENHPDPFMNFSATGLMFEDMATCAEEDTVLLELRVPQHTGSWRAAAKVIRVFPIPIDERDDSIAASHRIAIHFTDLPEDAAEALRTHTLRIQEAYL